MDGIQEKLKHLTVTDTDREFDGKELGRGAYAKVFTIKYRGAVYAAKEIYQILVEGVEEEQKQAIKNNFMRECYQCSNLQHENIVQFIGICYLRNDSYLPVMIMELMDHSLTSFIRDKPEVDIKVKLSILLNVSRGLTYLHSRDPPIIHRDLSPNNVMLTDKLVAKIGDLGVAKLIQTDSKHTKNKMTKAPGTTDFMPPESLTDNPAYDTSLDIFSFGGVTLFIMGGEWPTPIAPIEFDPKTRAVRGFTEVERRQHHLCMMVGEAGELRSLVEKCLDNDPATRPTAITLSASIKAIADKRKPVPSNLQMKQDDGSSDAMHTISTIPTDMNIRHSRLRRSLFDTGSPTASPRPLTRTYSPSLPRHHHKSNVQVHRTNSVPTQKQPPKAPPPLLLAAQSSKFQIKWTRCADLPHKMHGASVAVDKQNIFVTDTNSPRSNPRNDVYCYNMLSHQWKELPRPEQYYFVLLVVNGQLIAIGGLDSIAFSKTSKVLTFSQTENRWISHYPNLLIPRFKPGAVVHCDQVIVVGGQTSNGIADDIEILNVRQVPLVWQRAGICLPSPMLAMQLAICEEHLFIVGYSDNTATYRNVYCIPVMAFSLDQSFHISQLDSLWTEEPKSPFTRVGLASTHPPMIAGGSFKSELTSDVYILNAHSHVHTWKKVASLTSPRANVAIATINNTTIMVIGGYSKGGSVEAAAESSLTTVELGEMKLANQDD